MNQVAELPTRPRSDLAILAIRVVQNRIVQSALRSILVGFGVMTIAFFLLRLVPGDPIQVLLGDAATPDLVNQYRSQLGLDGSLPQQFATYTWNILHGNLGTSIATGVSVNSHYCAHLACDVVADFGDDDAFG